MSQNAFLVDRRDIEFALFEHQRLESLFELDYFKHQDRSLAEQMLTVTIDFCRDVLGPLNRSGDAEGCSFDPETHQVTTPDGSLNAWKAYAENGFMVLTVPEDEGGIQAPILLGIALGELFSGSNPAFMMYPGLTRTAAHLLRTHGLPWMKEVVVERLISGEWAGTMCLTEPSVGTAVGDLRSMAYREGDHYKIKGTKQWVSGGAQDLTDNVIQLILARVEGAPKGIKGVSMFLVPTRRFDQETGELIGPNDVKCVGIEHKMGIHANSTCLLQFGDDDECIGYLIGEENRGIEYMFKMMNEARIGTGLQAQGQASIAFLNAEAYAKQRIQGTRVDSFRDVDAERVPIIEHPDVRRMLLRQRALVEGGRALVYYAGRIADLSRHASDEETRESSQGTLEILTPIVKAWCSDMGYEVAVQAIQTHGGYGYTRDYTVEQIARDLKVASIYEGTNGIQALDLVGRKMRLKGGMLFMGFMAELNDLADRFSAHEAISEEGRLWGEAVVEIGEAAMHIAGVGQAGEPAAAVLNAYPYLMAMGHVVVGRLLLEQAMIAREALQGELTDSDQRFYRNKVRTAKFFIHNILPEARAQLAVVKGDDRSPLEFEFSEEAS